jgi:uncharacterized protein YjiS (DUF1127 family)
MSTPATVWSNARPRVWRDFQLPALQHVVRAFLDRRAIRRAERELFMLDDRTLKDIGLTRWEIHHAVRRRRSAPGSHPFGGPLV